MIVASGVAVVETLCKVMFLLPVENDGARISLISLLLLTVEEDVA